MKINNKRIVSNVHLLYVVLILGNVLFVALYILEIYLFYAYYEIIYLIPLILLMFFFWRGHQHVVYDSEGEIIHIKTREAFLSNFFPHLEVCAEFPKNKLVGFKLKDYFIKKILILTLRSKRARLGYIKLRYNVTYLNRKEIKNLSYSLRNTIKRSADSKTDVFRG